LKVCQAIAAGNSVLVLGEAGTGTEEFAQNLYSEMSGEFQTAIATYKGSLKKFFTAIAFQLDIPTTETQYNKNGDPTGEKDLTLKEVPMKKISPPSMKVGYFQVRDSRKLRLRYFTDSPRS
jgi:hypothetical protein